ncbi:MAG: PrsW family glutamic-type intramembrane protease [Planctomycetota bacterium]
MFLRFDAKQSELASIRDSVRNEPAITSKEDQPYLGDWIEQKRAQCSVPGNLGVVFLAAILAGPFAILGAFMAARDVWYGVLYVVVFGPVLEELLKQSGMIYLLEEKPYRVFAAWQFVFSALVAALVFATIENLLYINVYIHPATLKAPEVFAGFRWTVCTAVHLFCSAIASLGMIRVWKKQLRDGKPADLSVAFAYFAVAMAVHGAYNLTALFLNKYFLK